MRFGGQLIGPELFPTYLTVLRVNLAITLIIGAVSLIVGGSIWSAIAGVVVPFVIQFTIVTLLFIWVDRRWLRDPDGWDPRTVNSMGPDIDVSTLDGLAVQLIGKQHTRAVAITTSVLEIGLLAIALTFWFAIGLPEQIGFLKPGPGWTDVWPAATVVILFALSIPVVNLFRPTWTLPGRRPRADGHRLDRGPRGLAHAGCWVVLVDPASATADEQDLVELINTIVRISVALTLVLTAINGALGTPVRAHGARHLRGLNRHTRVAQCGPCPTGCRASSRPCWPRSWPLRSTTRTGSSRSSGTASAWRPSSRATSADLDPWRAGRGALLRAFLVPPTWIAARDAIVDGEVIAFDDHGEPDFALLQARIKGQGQLGTPTPFVYEVFDLLWLDGRSLLDEPLETRRRLLAEALRPDPRVRLSEHITGDGIAFSRQHGCAGSKASWPRIAARPTCPARAPWPGRRSRSGRSRSSSWAA